jgi:2-polyprenyl-6-methoxyphenol hydroxylase-like FAD-dependent oxidoreductase
LNSPDRYDVVIVGGAFAGAATALLLRRQMPSLRVLIVEKLDAFDAKVGEATTEMSAMFLTRRLALWQHLERQPPAQGRPSLLVRQRPRHRPRRRQRSGGFPAQRGASFQLRRDVLDEHLLKLAVDEGAELIRPATVRVVRIEGLRQHRHDRAKDARGQRRSRRDRPLHVADRRLGPELLHWPQARLIDWNDEHPIASIWARWTGVKHIDDLAARAGGRMAAGNVGSRRLATNHYVGHGYWIWVIPSATARRASASSSTSESTNSTSRRNAKRPTSISSKRTPRSARLLDGANRPPRRPSRPLTLAYVTRQYMGPGWALVGDAAAFIDPYYSPGLDHCAFSAEATARIILKPTRGETPGADAGRHRGAQRAVPPLVPPLLPVHLPRQVLPLRRARPDQRRRSCSTPRCTTSSSSRRRTAS